MRVSAHRRASGFPICIALSKPENALESFPYPHTAVFARLRTSNNGVAHKQNRRKLALHYSAKRNISWNHCLQLDAFFIIKLCATCVCVLVAGLSTRPSRARNAACTTSCQSKSGWNPSSRSSDCALHKSSQRRQCTHVCGAVRSIGGAPGNTSRC